MATRTSWKQKAINLSNAIFEFTTEVDKLMLGAPSLDRGVKLSCLLTKLRDPAHEVEALVKGPTATADRIMGELNAIAEITGCHCSKGVQCSQ